MNPIENVSGSGDEREMGSTSTIEQPLSISSSHRSPCPSTSSKGQSGMGIRRSLRLEGKKVMVFLRKEKRKRRIIEQRKTKREERRVHLEQLLDNEEDKDKEEEKEDQIVNKKQEGVLVLPEVDDDAIKGLRSLTELLNKVLLVDGERMSIPEYLDLDHNVSLIRKNGFSFEMTQNDVGKILKMAENAVITHRALVKTVQTQQDMLDFANNQLKDKHLECDLLLKKMKEKDESSNLDWGSSTAVSVEDGEVGIADVEFRKYVYDRQIETKLQEHRAEYEKNLSVIETDRNALIKENQRIMAQMKNMERKHDQKVSGLCKAIEDLQRKYQSERVKMIHTVKFLKTESGLPADKVKAVLRKINVGENTSDDGICKDEKKSTTSSEECRENENDTGTCFDSGPKCEPLSPPEDGSYIGMEFDRPPPSVKTGADLLLKDENEKDDQVFSFTLDLDLGSLTEDGIPEQLQAEGMEPSVTLSIPESTSQKDQDDQTKDKDHLNEKGATTALSILAEDLACSDDSDGDSDITGFSFENSESAVPQKFRKDSSAFKAGEKSPRKSGSPQKTLISPKGTSRTRVIRRLSSSSSSTSSSPVREHNLPFSRSSGQPRQPPPPAPNNMVNGNKVNTIPSTPVPATASIQNPSIRARLRQDVQKILPVNEGKLCEKRKLEIHQSLRRTSPRKTASSHARGRQRRSGVLYLSDSSEEEAEPDVRVQGVDGVTETSSRPIGRQLPNIVIAPLNRRVPTTVPTSMSANDIKKHLNLRRGRPPNKPVLAELSSSRECATKSLKRPLEHHAASCPSTLASGKHQNQKNAKAAGIQSNSQPVPPKKLSLSSPRKRTSTVTSAPMKGVDGVGLNAAAVMSGLPQSQNMPAPATIPGSGNPLDPQTQMMCMFQGFANMMMSFMCSQTQQLQQNGNQNTVLNVPFMQFPGNPPVQSTTLPVNQAPSTSSNGVPIINEDHSSSLTQSAVPVSTQTSAPTSPDVVVEDPIASAPAYPSPRKRPKTTLASDKRCNDPVPSKKSDMVINQRLLDADDCTEADFDVSHSEDSGNDDSEANELDNSHGMEDLSEDVEDFESPQSPSPEDQGNDTCTTSSAVGSEWTHAQKQYALTNTAKRQLKQLLNEDETRIRDEWDLLLSLDNQAVVILPEIPDKNLAIALYDMVRAGSKFARGPDDLSCVMGGGVLRRNASMIFVVDHLVKKNPRLKDLPKRTLEYFIENVLPSRKIVFADPKQLTRLGQFYGLLIDHFKIPGGNQDFLFKSLYWRPPDAQFLIGAMLKVNSTYFNKFDATNSRVYSLPERVAAFCLTHIPDRFKTNCSKLNVFLKKGLVWKVPDYTLQELFAIVMKEIIGMEHSHMLDGATNVLAFICTFFGSQSFPYFRDQLIAITKVWMGKQVTDGVYAAVIKSIGAMITSTLEPLTSEQVKPLREYLEGLSPHHDGSGVLKDAFSSSLGQIHSVSSSKPTIPPLNRLFPLRLASKNENQSPKPKSWRRCKPQYPIRPEAKKERKKRYRQRKKTRLAQDSENTTGMVVM